MTAMLLLGAVSWLLRIAFITLLPADRLPAQLRNGLDYLAPSVLAAIVAVELVALLRAANPQDALILLTAAAAIGVVAYRTGNVSLSCALGLGVVFLV